MKIQISLSEDGWWSSLTKAQQKAYIAEHPNSKYAVDAREKAKKGSSAKPKGSASAGLVEADPDPSKWPPHIKVLKLPPAWTHVHYSSDKDADLQAVGKDAKGRSQYVYSEEFSKQQSAIKFARILELDSKFGEIEAQNSKGLKSKDPKEKDHAECLQLIMKMGLRPGGDDDTGAEKKAYGATTLLGHHVVEEDGKTFLRFVGKKGVDINLEVEDAELAKRLKARAKAANNGPLFPKIDASSLSEYTHTMDGGGFKTKDMRTRLGTHSANQIILGYDPKPTDAQSYKKAVREVATQVSKKLGNTPTVALQSYIAPQVWASWQPIEGIPEQKDQS